MPVGQLQLLGATTDESNPHVVGALGGSPILLPVQAIGTINSPGQAKPAGHEVHPSNPVVRFMYVPGGQDSGNAQETAGKPPLMEYSYALFITPPRTENLLGITIAGSPLTSIGTRRVEHKIGEAVPPAHEFPGGHNEHRPFVR